MDFQKKNLFFGKFPSLFLAILLFLSVYAVRKYFAYRNTPQEISRKFQADLSAAESQLKTRAGIFVSGFDTILKKERSQGKISGSAMDEDDDFFIFVYRNDSLVYWNNNSIILPDHFSREYPGTDFIYQLKNGWYGFHCVKKGSFLFVGSFLIKSEFPFQNEFINDHFGSAFTTPASVSIERKIGSYPIYSGGKTIQPGLNFDNFHPARDSHSILIFLLFLHGALCLLHFILQLLISISWFKNRPNLLVISYCLAVVCLRLIQNYSGFPAEIYDSELFSPAWYSSSAFLPSLGDFMLNSLVLMMISTVIYRRSSLKQYFMTANRRQHVILITLILAILILFFQLIGYLMAGLVINSSVALNFQNISGLTKQSGYGLLIIITLLSSFWMISGKLLNVVFAGQKQWYWLILSLVAASGISILFTKMIGGDFSLTANIFFVIYLFAYWFFNIQTNSRFPVLNILFLLFFFAGFATFILNRSNRTKETEKLSLLAGKIVSQRNPVTEVLYEQAQRRILTDSIVNQWINPQSEGFRNSQDSLDTYLKSHYFKDYWRKYQVQITFCDPGKELRIQPQGYLVNCNSYFRGIIDNYGKATILPGLFFLDYGIGKEYYLATISDSIIEPNISGQRAIFIEFNLKNADPDPGYPGLLMDKTRLDLPNLSDYSYGLFQYGRLIRAMGSTGYKSELGQYENISAGKPWFTEDKMIHYQYRINSEDTLLISKKAENFLSFVTPFSYLFVLLSFVTLVATLMVNFRKNLKTMLASLRNRLHFALVGLLLVTMVVVGIVQVINVIEINLKKNVDNLRERASSIVVEVQHKYSLLQDMREVSAGELEDFLVKLSNIFFTDINVYDKKGMLISSSRPQIFEEGLLSERMNVSGYQKLIVEKNSIFIHNEKIGSMEFSSAYLPFYNERDQLLGFVNLPYFAKQDEARKEISSFLVTFLNIYILIILFGILVTALISNYITAPLAMLGGKISQLQLGGVNEKISWKQNDEIGQLVSQYNRMIDALSHSAEMLAKSERESAWREMARQVAHEIKNPLTPMKLSTQYLERAWNEKAPDWDQRLSRFTKTMVEQIDALSIIASDFSDFAKMPTVVLARINLEEVIRFVLSMYRDTNLIKYELQTDCLEPIILGDRSQLIRVFTNLVNNAVQAISHPEQGVVRIGIALEGPEIIVSVSDNGCGISADRRKKIFQPDFTTKTSGMGLGLAIVKGIVEGMNGEITFISEVNKGTNFIIKFPANVEQS